MKKCRLYCYEVMRIIFESSYFPIPASIHGFSKKSRKIDIILERGFSLSRQRGLFDSFCHVIKLFLLFHISKLKITEVKKQFSEYVRDFSLSILGDI